MAIGLSDKEAEVYETLLRVGPASIPKLLETTPYKRGDMYNILHGLESWGLVEVSKDGKKTYTPAHPQRLEELLAEQHKEVEQAKKTAGQAIPALASMFRLISGKPGVRFFEGIEGLKEIYQDTLAEAGNIYAFLSPAVIEPSLKQWLDRVYLRRRVEKGIRAKVIAPSAAGTKEYHSLDEKNLRETRIVPHDQFPMDIEIDIYGKQKIAFISFGRSELIGFVVDSPAIHATMKSIFKLSWLQAKYQSTQLGRSATAAVQKPPPQSSGA